AGRGGPRGERRRGSTPLRHRARCAVDRARRLLERGAARVRRRVRGEGAPSAGGARAAGRAVAGLQYPSPRRGKALVTCGRAPAVVRDVDDVHAVLHAEGGVLGGGDPLEDEGYLVRVLEALDVIPGDARLVLGAAGALPPRLHVAGGEVALAPAVVGGVDGDAEGGVAVVRRAPDVVVHPGVVAPHIELVDAEVVRRLRRRLEAGQADRAQHLRDA